MKTMTCNQLGGTCDEKFHAKTWEEMKNLSMKHGHEMKKKGNKAHMAAMEKMKNMTPEKMQKWMGEKKKEFESLEANN